MSDELCTRIASALGWSESDVRSFNILALRDIVRPVSQKLADELSALHRSGDMILIREPKRRRN